MKCSSHVLLSLSVFLCLTSLSFYSHSSLSLSPAAQNVLTVLGFVGSRASPASTATDSGIPLRSLTGFCVTLNCLRTLDQLKDIDCSAN